MKMAVKQKGYQTEKLTFAAYLIASGKAQLVGTERHGSATNVLFVLSQAPTESELTGFFNGSAQVSALRYSETMNTLKSVAYEGRRRHGRL
jgi:hypothetical protein